MSHRVPASTNLVTPPAGNLVNPPRESWGIYFTLLWVAGSLLYRKPDALLHAQFWAEDGTIFFRDNYFHGLGALFIPYSGYYHVALRLIAWVAGFLPILWQPACYSWATFALTLLVAAKLFSARLALPYKPLLASALVLVPRSNGEILLTVTAVQWFLAVLLILFLIQAEAETVPQALRDLAVLVIVGLSGPFSILLLPLFVLRLLLVSHSAWSVVCTGIVAVCAAIQLHAVLMFPSAPNEHLPLSQWLEVFIRRPFGSLLLGTRITNQYVGLVPAVGLFIGLCLILGVLLARQRDHWWTGIMLLGAAGAVYAATAYRFLKAADLLFVGFDSGDRYFFLPKLLFVWCLMICLPGERWRVLRGATVGILVLMALAAAADFPCPAYADMQWSRGVREFERGETKSIMINPNWTIDLDKDAAARVPLVAVKDQELALEQNILQSAPTAIRSLNPVVRVTVDGQNFLQVHPPGELEFNVPPSSRAVDADFVIRPGAWQPPRPTAGVLFQADLVSKPGEPAVTLWKRVLRPAEIPADRGVQPMQVLLPPGTTGQLILRTLPPPGITDLSNDWACWANVRFEHTSTPK